MGLAAQNILRTERQREARLQEEEYDEDYDEEDYDEDYDEDDIFEEEDLAAAASGEFDFI